GSVAYGDMAEGVFTARRNSRAGPWTWTAARRPLEARLGRQKNLLHRVPRAALDDAAHETPREARERSRARAIERDEVEARRPVAEHERQPERRVEIVRRVKPLRR